LEIRTTAKGQAPSRGVLRLALSHDRQKRGERRRSAARGETIIESGQGRGLGGTEAEKRAQDQQGGDERDVRDTHLPLGK
jgi:hypothetical protein